MRNLSVDRFATPLYGIGEADAYLSIPPTTLTSWAYGYERHSHGGSSVQAKPVITALRPAIEALGRELGLEHALASRRLYTDGAEVLYDYAQHAGDTPEGDSARELVVVRNSQRVFTEVVDQYLSRVEFAGDGYARLIRLPQYAWPR